MRVLASGGAEPCFAAWSDRPTWRPLRQLGLGVRARGGHCHPLHGSNERPWAGGLSGTGSERPGQIGTGRLISRTQHEGRHSNSMSEKKRKKGRLLRAPSCEWWTCQEVSQLWCQCAPFHFCVAYNSLEMAHHMEKKVPKHIYLICFGIKTILHAV